MSNVIQFKPKTGYKAMTKDQLLVEVGKLRQIRDARSLTQPELKEAIELFTILDDKANTEELRILCRANIRLLNMELEVE